MTDRVFLHIGSPKTGTTYLQAILWKQRELLEQDGLLLPGNSIRDHFRATMDLRETPERAGDPTQVPGSWDRLVHEASAWDGDVLISHELLAPATAAQARTGLESFSRLAQEVHVVLTARDLARQLPADWQERVKHRSLLDFPKYIAQADQPGTPLYERLWAAQDYAGVLERWAPDIPAERVHVVTVPPAGAPKELLWQRFTGVLGLDAKRYSTDVPRENTSLGLEQAILLTHVNQQLGDRLPLPGRYTRLVKGLLAHQVLEGRPGTKLAIGGADLDFARDRSERIIEALGRGGYDVAGSLDDLRIIQGAAEEATSTPRGVVSSEQLLAENVEVTIELLELLGDRMEQWDEQRLKLRSDLRRTRERVRELEKTRGELKSRLPATLARRAKAKAGRMTHRALDVVRPLDRVER